MYEGEGIVILAVEVKQPSRTVRILVTDLEVAGQCDAF